MAPGQNVDEPRYCPCGTRIARDNKANECSPCMNKQISARSAREGVSIEAVRKLNLERMARHHLK